jgi:hypothetical protein
MRSQSPVVAPDQCTELHGNEPEGSRRATCGATFGDEGIRSEMPADLQSIVDAWGDIPAALRPGIVAMVLAARSTRG